MENIRQFLPLCWLSGSPLELPTSLRFLRQNMVFYFAVTFFIQYNMSDDIEVIFEVVLESALTLGFVVTILALDGAVNRFTQVGCAILFCQNFIAMILIPLAFWVSVAEDTASHVALSVFLLWAYIAIAHIFRQVLDINRPAAMVISLFYFLFTYGGAYGLDSLLMG